MKILSKLCTSLFLISSILCACQLGRSATVNPPSAEVVVTSASQLQLTLNTLPPAGGTVVLQNLVASGLGTVTISQSHVTIELDNCQLGYVQDGIKITGSDDTLTGNGNTLITAGGVAVILNGATSTRVEHLHINQSGYSGFMLEGSTSNARFVDDEVDNYNSLNQTGHAGFFIYGPVSRILFDHCSTSNGNGQGFRMDSPSALPEDIKIVNCDVEGTNGHSAEGIGPMGSDIWVVNCRIYKSGATGILVFNGRAGTIFHNIFIIGNSIGDSSQEVAGNAAIQIHPASNKIQGLVISNNIAWDDQPTPTSQVMLSITNGGQGGSIDSLSVTGNISINQRNQAGISNSIPVGDLTNSYVGLASSF